MQDFHSLLIIMVVVWVAGKIFRALKLPVIFGELLGGILVGPYVLDIVQTDSESIKLLAELGIFFLMLHAGLETNPRELLKSSKKAILIAVLSMFVPFTSVLALASYLGYAFNESLFLAMTLSITALAVTVRVFKDYKINNTKLGHITIGAAVLNDILGLILFSIVVSVIESGTLSLEPLLITLVKTTLFFGIVMYCGFKFSKYFRKFLRNKGFTSTFILALALGLLAEQIGLHMIIGAFLAGLFIREEVVDPKVFNKIEDRIYGLSYSLLAPIFFASLAFHLDFSIIKENWEVMGLLLLTAVLGKIFGSYLGAIVQKIKAKQALVIGVALNSRGAIDLVIASIGFNQGIIGEDLFSILVFISFTATLITIFALKPIVKYAK